MLGHDIKRLFMMEKMKNAHKMLAQNLFEKIYLGDWVGDGRITYE